MNARTVASLLTITAVAMVTSGCETITSGTTGAGPVTPAKRLQFTPDYDAPDSQFVEADFNTLASEFIDEYANQYVIVRGRFASHQQGVLLTDPQTGRYVSYGDVMSATITSPESLTRHLRVIWSVQDRELGRPFLNLKMHAPVKIFGYVVPAQTAWYMQSRKDVYFTGIPATTVVLIRAVPDDQ
jgi:hypothetical protein